MNTCYDSFSVVFIFSVVYGGLFCRVGMREGVGVFQWAKGLVWSRA